MARSRFVSKNLDFLPSIVSLVNANFEIGVELIFVNRPN